MLASLPKMHFNIGRGNWIRTNDDDFKDRCLRPLGDTPTKLPEFLKNGKTKNPRNFRLLGFVMN